ncbi:MAG: 50S ribosomal protein L6 [Candidatus Blackburnbacteria bacterium]|nr:50S ribosomal protein L6 [Candidatus Blackburnbacteria bacterium]
MSKIGKKPLIIPEGVTLQKEGRMLRVLGPKGELSFNLPVGVEVVIKDDTVNIVQTDGDTTRLVGLYGRLIANAIVGVVEGWTKTLELIGTGYRARLEGNDLVLALGFSHPIRITAPAGVSFSVEENRIKVLGSNREVVGQIAANIRMMRPPEPYQGKGVRYQNEYVRRKAGKSAKTGAKAA